MKWTQNSRSGCGLVEEHLLGHPTFNPRKGNNAIRIRHPLCTLSQLEWSVNPWLPIQRNANAAFCQTHVNIIPFPDTSKNTAFDHVARGYAQPKDADRNHPRLPASRSSQPETAAGEEEASRQATAKEELGVCWHGGRTLGMPVGPRQQKIQPRAT